MRIGMNRAGMSPVTHEQLNTRESTDEDNNLPRPDTAPTTVWRCIMKRFACVLAVVAVVLAASVAQATVITPYVSDTGSFPVSDTDQPGTGATIMPGAVVWVGSAANLNNGGGGSLEGGVSAGCGLQPGNVFGYSLSPTNAPLGWNVNEITSYASWDAGGGGRSSQGYSVIAYGADWSVKGVLPAQTYVDATGKVASKVDITDLGWTGVSMLVFRDFIAAPPGLGNVYHEFDVFGTPTSNVPEPGTIVLLATGLIGLLCYAWRRRK
jgi:hypothetical protein